MLRKIFIVLLIIIASAVCASAGDLINSSAINIRQPESLNMSGSVPEFVKRALTSSRTEAPGYNLAQMKQVNPNFTAYPNEQGIIWQKRAIISRMDSGGLEIVRLYIILGRRGLSRNWLDWNIPIPARGSAEVLEASIYDFESLTRINSATPETNSDAGIIAVNFQGMPENFIIALSWREEFPEQINIEGLSWFQENLRVWESIIEVYSPDEIFYRTFPEIRRAEIQNIEGEKLYRWRVINSEPYNPAGELARLQRGGVAFSTKRGNVGIVTMLREIENYANAIKIPSEATKKNPSQLCEWLMRQPEISLAEGGPRKIPANSPLTREEKILLAKSWLASEKYNASVVWEMPFDLDANTPLCSGLFFAPVLEVQGEKDFNFHDLRDEKLLAGAKIFGLTNDGKLLSRRVPGTSASENKLSAIMDLRMNEHGILNGNVKIILRGSWGAFLLGKNPTDGTARGAVLSLFPGLTNYKDVKYKNVKGVPEINFVIENKPGVGGTGTGILALPPFFEPVAMRRLGNFDAPVEVLFPFVVDLNMTLGLPKTAAQALVSGNTPKGVEKINFSSNYQNRRHRLIADARIEVNMQNISAGNMSTLRRCLDQWRMFAVRDIPVR